MKNIRLLFSGLCLFLATGLGSNQAVADDVKAPGKVKLKIETKELSKEDAASIIASDGKISLGVYLVFDAAWESTLNNYEVRNSESRMSFAFFNTKDCTPGDYFNTSTADYITICGSTTRTPAPSWGCGSVASFGPDWYASITWYTYGVWPTWSYGAGFSGGIINPAQTYFKNKDGNFEIKLFDLQFILKQATRDIPVGFLDGLDLIDASSGNTELNILTPGMYAYRPQGPDGNLIVATDWTDSRIGSNFEFVNGGIFFQNGPEVETFEPYFLS